jgi:hypothetical protein
MSRLDEEHRKEGNESLQMKRKRRIILKQYLSLGLE